MASEFYTGLASSETPEKVRAVMWAFAEVMRQRGARLRTGAELGAREGFRAGAGPAQTTYIPWDFYCGASTTLGAILTAGWEPAIMRAAMTFGDWRHLSADEKALAICAVVQLMGLDMKSPSRLVVCWVTDETTAPAITIAKASNIPVLNMQRPDHLKRIIHMIKTHRSKAA